MQTVHGESAVDRLTRSQTTSAARAASNYCSFAYSALASFRMGMSGSASSCPENSAVRDSKGPQRWFALECLRREDPLLQLRVFCFGFLQDRDVGVGIFPQREKIFVSGECPNAGAIGTRTLRGFRLQSIPTSHAQMRQRSRPAVPHDAAVIENLLKLGGGSAALPGGQVRFSAY